MVHEGVHVMAFLDLYPLSTGHALVIPRRHVNDLTALTPEERDELFLVGQRVLAAQRSIGLGVEGANLLLNDGSAANQHVPHLHLHVVPRKRGDLFLAIFKFALRALGPLGAAGRREKLDALAGELRF